MKKWNDLSEDIRSTIDTINSSIAQASHGIQIQGMWESRNIRGLTKEDKDYLRDEVVRLLKEGRTTLLEDD